MIRFGYIGADFPLWRQRLVISRGGEGDLLARLSGIGDADEAPLGVSGKVAPPFREQVAAGIGGPRRRVRESRLRGLGTRGGA